MLIRFTHRDKEYIGEFDKVSGAGQGGVYHLMIDKFYKGRLRFSTFTNTWVFDGEFADLADRFGRYVQSTC
jgi:hypothetical protein